jgi:tRNA-splicing endonuclease subunit Sen15, fungi type
MQSTGDPSHDVSLTVLRNLEDQHDWTQLEIHQVLTGRSLILGLPPRRLYIHPDDQIAALVEEHATGKHVEQGPVKEWVLPVHLSEGWTLARFAAVFSSVALSQSGRRDRRIVLAVVHNDSTVVYYLMHEGMVKPRQN